jgi:uncharacterized protein (DUF488 family)
MTTPDSPPILYTAGHGNRSLDELLTLLREAAIETLVDVRAHPASRRHPQFGSESLRQALEEQGIVYHWAGRQLGGLRAARPDSRHAGLPEGLRGYADYMETEAFGRAAQQLVGLAARGATAILCAERYPDQCHRSLIADDLTLRGVRVLHLMEPGVLTSHRLHPALQVQGGVLVYCRGSQPSLRFDA